MATVRHLGFEVLKFLVDRHIGWLIYIVESKISPKLVKWFFDQLVTSGGLICAIVQNFFKISQTVSEISWFFRFSRWPPSSIVDFEIFQFLVFRQFESAKMHHHTKFRQNRLNGCRDIAFFKMAADFWTFLRVRRDNVRSQRAKFRRNRPNRCWNIAIYPFFKMAAVRHFGFVEQILGRPTRIWWYLSLCKIW